MPKKLILFSLILLFKIELYAQNTLTPEFHAKKRQEVRAKLPANSVAVYFSAAIRNRANDVDYHYHQDPNFYYLTGFKEPHSLLLIYKEMQTDENGDTYNEVLFVQPHHPREELYNGPRLGVEGAKKELKFEKALFNTEFKEFSMNLEQLEKILFFDFKNDVRKERGKTGDLYELIAQFKEKVGYPIDFSPQKEMVYKQITESKDHEYTTSFVRNIITYYPELAEDQFVIDYLKTKDVTEREKLIGNIMPPPSKLDALSLTKFMTDVREIKTPEEIDLLRKAVDISCIAQSEVMKAIHAEMSETEVYGIHEYVFKKYGAMFEGYPGIVGVGNNGCVLHYIQNDKPKLGEELVLMDLGAEYYGYTADVTRTIPVNGKFSTEQKAIYNLVLKAQEEAFKACKPGNEISSTTQISREVVAKGLVELGLIKDESEVRKYFPHGVSHHIGLDVHDPGNYELFEENMALTVEPGIYIPKGSDCDKKWWGIGVRIEDDILITKTGYELLSDKAPRTVKQIEALMMQSSPLSDLKLPDLED